jgi:hypothetical protein
MLFQGSTSVGANEHFELVQRAGGTLNGSTWLDRTNYYETVPSNQLELALWLEANRMGYLLPAMTQQKLDTQRDVVQNERRWSMDNQPYGSWWERLPALCFPSNHPFHHSLIGSMSDLDAASLEDIEQFFTTFYTPDNAVLSIAGDFDPRRCQATGGAPLRPDPPRRGQAAAAGHDIAADPWRAVARGRAGRRRAVASLPGFSVPRCSAVTSTMPRACAERSSGLRKGSRLHRRLVREQQIAAEAQSFTYDLTKGSDLLVLDVTARPETPTEELERAVNEEVDQPVRHRCHGGGGCTRRDAHRDRVDHRASGGPAIARTSSRCSRHTSAIRRS